jgi:signal transduction histidine kinase
VAGTPIAEGAKTSVLAADGTLWFSTSGGATLVDPARVGASPPLPPIRIESVAADAQRFVPETRVFEPSSASHVHVGFNALTMTDPTRIRFRYRLDDYDHGWVDAGTSREASYINLPPGQYRFVVEATNGDGVWKTGATTDFGIAPMFYRTTWFYALCAVLVAAAVTGAWRLRVGQVRRQFALVLGERIRMSREIHDTLLQGLAGLALEIDDLSHNLDGARPGAQHRVLAMRRRVEAYLREARLSIWDMRTPQVAARDFPQALREVGERAIGDRPVRLDLVINGEPQRCPARVKEQLLLIGQEAVNNAVRHGHPTRVDFELDCDEHRTRLRVSDDGQGFDPDDAEAIGHYGLRGMRERAEQVRGTILIDSSPGRGTRVEATVPI